jgi:hypothetical protein
MKIKNMVNQVLRLLNVFSSLFPLAADLDEPVEEGSKLIFAGRAPAPHRIIAAGDDDIAKTRARDRAVGRNGAAAPAAVTNKAASGESGERRKSEEHNGSD